MPHRRQRPTSGGIKSVQNVSVNIHFTAAVSAMTDHFFISIVASRVKADVRQTQHLSGGFFSLSPAHYFLFAPPPSIPRPPHTIQLHKNMRFLLWRCGEANAAVRPLLLLFDSGAEGRLFIIPASLPNLCLSLLSSHLLSFSSLFSCLTEGAAGSCRVGGGALIQFILLLRDRQRREPER